MAFNVYREVQRSTIHVLRHSDFGWARFSSARGVGYSADVPITL